MPAFYFGYVILAVAIVAKSVKGFGQANIIGCEHATLSRALRHIAHGFTPLSVSYTIPSMTTENGISTSLNSILFSVATWTGAVLQIPLGKLVDRFGSRRCEPPRSARTACVALHVPRPGSTADCAAFPAASQFAFAQMYFLRIGLPRCGDVVL